MGWPQAERVVHSQRTLVFGNQPVADGEVLPVTAAQGDAAFTVAGAVLVAALSGAEQIFRLRLGLGAPFFGNGVSLRLRVSGWKTLTSVLVGYSHPAGMRRITIGKLWRERWLEVSFGQGDLCFGIQNGWSNPGADDISELHVHLTGQPTEPGATLELERVQLWHEAEADFRIQGSGTETTFRKLLAEPSLGSRFSRPDPVVLDALYASLAQQHFAAIEEAAAFMTQGLLPSYRASLSWPHDVPQPPALAEINSYRWSWHSLHPVMMLLIYARQTETIAPVFAARDFVSAWLERSFYAVDADQKYTWYDHGVADRVVAMVMLWEQGLRLSFDQRFMARLLEAIFRHCQLLGTEMFYAYHQPMRYHNHAVFQDLALLAAARCIPELGGSSSWVETASARFADQLERLVVREQGMAICVENSLGYHVGLESLVALANRLIGENTASAIPLVAQEMARFTELTRYADGRQPAFGDSSRQKNPTEAPAAALPAYADPSVTVLHEVGQVFVKGNHDTRPFMLSVTASSLTETHKHQDNLAFSLFFDGVEWLIDPSFYCYEPTQAVARYLRSAAAHNAVVLPGGAYAIGPGLAALGAAREADDFRVYGRHTAYSAARVEREIRGRLDVLTLTFVERVVLQSAAEAPAGLLMLHCGDGVSAELSGRALTLRHPASTFELKLELPSDGARQYCGVQSEEAVRGMTGLGFMECAPIVSVECDVATDTPASWSLMARTLSSS